MSYIWKLGEPDFDTPQHIKNAGCTAIQEGYTPLYPQQGQFGTQRCCGGDEVYERFTYDGIKHHTTLKLPGMGNNLIVINSFSKTYAMTGWRLGFLVSRNEDITQTLDGLQGYTLISPSSMAQRAGIAALLESQEATERMKEEYEERRNLLISLLEDIPDIDFVKPTGAFYLFLNISKYMDSYSFADGLLRSKKVAVAPGATFGTHGEEHIRLSFTTSKERIKKAWKIERISFKMS